LQKNKAESTKFSKTGTYKGKETTTTTTDKPANGTGATTASERRNSAEVTKSRGFGGSATSKGGVHTYIQERRGGTRTRRVSKKTRRQKKSELATRAAKQVMLHLQDKAYK
jgi:hypothetical protein